MPQLQNLVLTDRTSPTPVNHTFTPLDVDANGVGVVEATNGTPIGSPKFTIQNRRANGSFKVRLRLSVPVVQTETINGVSNPKIVRSGHVDAVFTFHQTSSEQERRDIVGMFASSLETGKVLVNDTLVKLQGVY